MLLFYNPDILNKFKNYIKFYIQINITRFFIKNQLLIKDKNFIVI